MRVPLSFVGIQLVSVPKSSERVLRDLASFGVSIVPFQGVRFALISISP